MSDDTDPYNGYFTFRSKLTSAECRELSELGAKAGRYLDKAAGERVSKAERLLALESAGAEISRARKICRDVNVTAIPYEIFRPLVDKSWSMMEAASQRGTERETGEWTDEIAEKVEEIFWGLSGLADMRDAPIAARRALLKKVANLDVILAEQIKEMNAADPDNFFSGVSFSNRMAFALGLTNVLVRFRPS